MENEQNKERTISQNYSLVTVGCGFFFYFFFGNFEHFILYWVIANVDVVSGEQ